MVQPREVFVYLVVLYLYQISSCGFLISTSVVRSVEVGGAGCAGRPREKEALAVAGRGWSLLSSSSWQLVGSQ